MPLDFTAPELRQRYNQVAPYYDRAEWIIEAVLFGRLRRELFGKARGDLLEVAVGTGKNLVYSPPNVRITAIDVSEGMLARARERAVRLGRAVAFCRMDAQALAFPDASFDTVTSSLSTCTFPDPVAALSEMARVCRPGGQILLLEHGRANVAAIGRAQDRLADWNARIVGCHWNRPTLDLVQRAGLRLVAVRTHVAGAITAIEATP